MSSVRRVNFGSVSEQKLLAVLSSINRFMDFNRKYSDATSSDQLLERYTERIRKDLPSVSKYLARLVDFKSVGTPGGETEASHVRIVYDVKKAPLRERFPELYRVFNQTIVPSELSVQVSDSQGRRLFEYRRNGTTVHHEFFTRDGQIIPIVEGKPVTDTGYSPRDLRRMDLLARASSGMTMYGLYFGMEGMVFRSEWNHGTVTWRLTEAPELNLPWGIRLILSSFINPFLSYLETGHNGSGLRYQETFHQQGRTVFHQEQVHLPLKDTPIIPFLLKLHNLAWQPLDKPAKKDLYDFVRAIGERIRNDYGNRYSQ
ncbi:MAG: hypothetical protein ABEK50_15570 [bacterium]